MTREESYTLTLLALAMYREAAFEPELGIIAVGCVIRERVNMAQGLLKPDGTPKRAAWFIQEYLTAAL